MKISNNKFKIHIKNNHWTAGSFPNTSHGEKVFTITEERFKKALSYYPQLEKHIEFFIDWDEDNFITSMKDANILITWNFPTSNLNKIAPKLKWIHCISAGIEHLLPLDWLPDTVILTNNTGVHKNKAGISGLMAVLMLCNRIPSIVTNQREKNYKQIYGSSISNSTIVIVGTGGLGSATAKMLEPFNPNIIGVNRQGRTVSGYNKIVTVDKIEEVLPLADILYLALPITPETCGLINQHRLSLLKPSCGIVNIGRQSATDYETICEMLKTNKLSGAVLDVFTPEPISSDSYLWNVPNLIITPHVLADDADMYIPTTLDLFMRNLENFLSNQPLINQVDKKFGY
jgi:phosphoglycerate dehydrogenase-like enzyme